MNKVAVLNDVGIAATAAATVASVLPPQAAVIAIGLSSLLKLLLGFFNVTADHSDTPVKNAL